MKTRQELIKAYIDFFVSKKHKQIPNSPLVPANDPTVLFTTAGMHPLVPFLLGNPHPQGKRLVNVQKCIRTTDIEAVGDSCHHTFFEMIGNWSLGDYWKKEAIEFSYEFATKILKLDKTRLAVSVFAGDNDAKKDEEAGKIWQSLGIPKERIAYLPKEDNWWGPAGKTGPCGPCTETFYWVDEKEKAPKVFNPKDKRWLEIWNDVLMQYVKDETGKYNEAKQKNIDNGRGTERILAVLLGYDDSYLTEIWSPLIKKIEKLSKKKYEENAKAMRIVADHIKASVFILNEKVVPSNTERGYVIRRLIRRAIRYGKTITMQNNFTQELAKIVFEIYPDYTFNKEFILKELDSEETKFRETIASGLANFEKIAKNSNQAISGKDAFLLYQSYGFPIEITQELAKERGLEVDMIDFEKEQIKHQELSRTASAGQFKSGLADNSEQTTKYHTATHLLLSALKQVLKKEVEQRGSNINSERLRFDFSQDEKLSACQLQEIEDIVNKNIQKGLQVKREEMSLAEAKKAGATGIFEDKYGNKVSVYTICDAKSHISKEICTGPHVTNTKDLGKFKILKEEASSKGVRRIKAALS